MCGINGIVDYQHSVDTAIIKKMNKVLQHRGPDGMGEFLSHDQVCAFGHVRLSIIDVEGSSQPLCNENGTVWITYNGEIYNYKELKEILLNKGHRFTTQGDTEVLVHLYEEFGVEMVKHLYGMFAFAIWDANNQRLFVVRDRLGVKPLYFSALPGKFIFSSEQKGVIHSSLVEKKISNEGIWHYLTFRSVPGPFTLYENVHKLSPGHYLLFDERGLQIHKYWDISVGKDQNINISDGDLIENLDFLLKKSINRRLISDVPLGAFLSGGVDSSLIVALMTKLTAGPVKTYTVGFENFGASEAPYAKIVADLYKTDHHELILKEDVYEQHLEMLTQLRDAPLSEPADIPLYLLSKMASEKVKVLLSGEGSDELFAGYPKYRYDQYHQYMNFIPGFVLDNITRLLPSRFRRVETAIKSLKEQDAATRWAQWFAPFNIDEKKQLFTAPSNNFINPLEKIIHDHSLNDSLSSQLFCDCKIWLPDNLLDRGDRMTMGGAIEGRVPFLDHDLVELAFRLPDNVKIRQGHGKWIIKQIAMKYLPYSIVYRPKAGFVVPLADWFRGRLRDYCYDQICSTNGLPDEFVSRKSARRILDAHCSYKKDNFLKIWTLLGLSLWFNTCFNGKRTI